MYLLFHSLILTILSVITSPPENIQQNHGPILMVKSFSWKDCGSGSESIQIKSLNVSPDPLIVPGLLSLKFTATNSKTLSSPISLSIVIKKKVVFVWVKIPCEDNIGSCHYKDVCSIIPPECPDSFIQNKIPCKCPIRSGNFILPLSPVTNISGSAIPKWLESGVYEVKVTLNDKSGTELLCVDVYAKLEGK